MIKCTKINKKIVAIIPARGGSKGISRKNIKLLSGKPLIVYTIEVALKCECLSRVIVSTDDEEIADISKKYGAEVIIRPHSISGDKSPVTDALRHTTEFLFKNENYKPDAIVLLQPTSPLRNAEDINLAVFKFLSGRYGSVVSVCEVRENPYLFYKLENDFLVSLISSEYNYAPRQEIPKIYKLNGAVYVFKKELLMIGDKLIGHKTGFIVMPVGRSVDIDTLADFVLAEAVLKNKN